eukprot:scaffold1397_cov254-Pinguiococcus_pyrenoidosus.AAC.24
MGDQDIVERVSSFSCQHPRELPVIQPGKLPEASQEQCPIAFQGELLRLAELAAGARQGLVQSSVAVEQIPGLTTRMSASPYRVIRTAAT